MRFTRALFVLPMLACSTPAPKDDALAGIVTADELGAPPEEAEDLPVYVVVHRNSKLHLKPNASSAFIQYRTPEEVRAIEEAERERLRKIAERERLAAEKKKEAARKKRELARKNKKKRKKKRKKKKKKPPPTPEQLEAARERARQARLKRARKELRARTRKARRDPMDHPNRHHAVFRLLDERDGWAHLETLPSAEQRTHCHQGAHPGLGSARLRLYVRTSELATILTRPEKLALRKQTRVHLQPGVVLEAGEARSVAHVDGYSFRLPIPSDVIGTRYSHPHVYPQSETDMAFSPVAWVEDLVKVDKKRVFPYSPHYDLFIQQIGRAGKYAYATLQTRCGEYVVRAKPEWVDTLTSRAVKRIGGDEDDLSMPYIKKGARLTHPDGSVFGATTDDLPVGPRLSSGKGSCHALSVWKGGRAPRRAVTVCAASDDVVTQ